MFFFRSLRRRFWIGKVRLVKGWAIRQWVGVLPIEITEFDVRDDNSVQTPPAVQEQYFQDILEAAFAA
jgi:hypothetical protein